MKKVCFVIDSLVIGGANILTVHLANYLSENNWEVKIAIVYSNGVNALDLIGNLNKEIKVKKYDFMSIGLKSRINILREDFKDCDIIHSCLEIANLYSLFVNYFFTRKKIIVTSHGIDGLFIDDVILKNYIQKNVGWKYKMQVKHLLNFFLQKADLIIAVSEKTKEFLTSVRKISPNKIKVIYHGIFLDDLKSNNVAVSNLKNLYQIGPADFVIGYLGRLAHAKGLEDSILLFKKISAVFDNFKFILVGSGEIKSTLEDTVRDYGLENKVIFTGTQTDVSNYFDLFDVFILPSSSEGIPLSLLEAMYLEKICVATSVGGIPEIIDNDINGFLFPKEKFEALQEILIDIYKNFSKYKFIKSEAKHKIEKTFDLKKNLKNIELEFNRILKK